MISLSGTATSIGFVRVRFCAPPTSVFVLNGLPLLHSSLPLGRLVARSSESVDVDVPVCPLLRFCGLDLLEDWVSRSGGVAIVPDEDPSNNRASYSSQSSSEIMSMASWLAYARTTACSRCFWDMPGVNLQDWQVSRRIRPSIGGSLGKI